MGMSDLSEMHAQSQRAQPEYCVCKFQADHMCLFDSHYVTLALRLIASMHVPRHVVVILCLQPI